MVIDGRVNGRPNQVTVIRGESNDASHITPTLEYSCGDVTISRTIYLTFHDSSLQISYKTAQCMYWPRERQCSTAAIFDALLTLIPDDVSNNDTVRCKGQ